MFNHNYLEMVTENVIDYINSEVTLCEWEWNREGLEEHLNDVLWTHDSVTGNGSGSYTFNTFKAMEYVTENMDDLCDMCREFCVSDEEIGRHFLNGDWEWMDVSIRCYYLAQAISDALDEFDDELEPEEEEHDDDNE